MDFTQAKQRIEWLKAVLWENSRKYYVENAPTMSDYEYDQLMHELEDLEKQYPEYRTADSPTQRVGSDITKGFTQVRHERPMMSLSNSYSIEEVQEFLRRAQDGLGGEPSEIVGEMKYDGFRYDMTLGFHGRYLKLYNEAAQPYISVSELWHSIDRQKQHLQECEYNTMVFDFQMKYSMRGIVDGSYGKLNANKSFEGLRKHGLSRYSVTFIDNHDTFDRGTAYGDNQYTKSTDLTTATNKDVVLQASAYMLMMPGIPCVFYPHWVSYKDEINELIAVRKRAGIHSQSQVLEEESGQYKYQATIQGHRGKVIVRVGKFRSTTVPEGFELAVEGGDRGQYSVYVKMGNEAVENVEAEQPAVRKIIYNGHVYILREGQTYTLTGSEIKIGE